MKRRKTAPKARKGIKKEVLLKQMTGNIRGRPKQKLSFWQRIINRLNRNKTAPQKRHSATTRGVSIGWGSAELAEKRTASTKSVWDLFQHRQMSAEQEQAFDRLSGEVADLKKFIRKLRKRGCTNEEIRTVLPKNLGERYDYSKSALREIIVNAGLSRELSGMNVHYNSAGELIEGKKTYDFRRNSYKGKPDA